MLVNDFQTASRWIQEADAILVTASNGLSIAEGYHIFANNDDFRRYFGRFQEKYGVDCLIRGVFTPMTAEDRGAYMQTVHRYLIDDYKGSQVMRDLMQILDGKDYFLLTSNADIHFQINGFDPNRIFEIEGNFHDLQEGSPQWQEQKQRYEGFVQGTVGKKVVLLELGIGSRNRLIKAPTMQLAADQGWKFITMNMPQEIHVPEALQPLTIALTGDIGANFKEL